jgi:hypothetical protein
VEKKRAWELELGNIYYVPVPGRVNLGVGLFYQWTGAIAVTVDFLSRSLLLRTTVGGSGIFTPVSEGVYELLGHRNGGLAGLELTGED